MRKEIKPYSLLVIEDNPGDYVLLQLFLQLSKLPIEKIVHTDSITAVPVNDMGTVFDIVFLDLTLPDSTGIDSVITLNRLMPKTPIIVFSGLSTIETAIEAISLGAQDYLVKGEFDGKLLTKSIQYSIERKRATEKLRENNELYEFVNKATNDTIWEWNYLRGEGQWGDGIIKTFGYSEAHRKYDESWVNEFIHPEDKERVITNLEEHILNGLQNWEDEFRFRCANGTYKNVYDRGYILFDNNKKPYRIIGAMSDLSEKKKLEKEIVEQQILHQKLITQASIQAQEKEKNQLGIELHDNINQILATVKMYLGIAKSKQHADEDLIDKSYEYVNEAMEAIRMLSHSLVTPSLGDIGLKEALGELAEELNRVSSMKIEINVDEKLSTINIDKNKELMLYRIVQEQLNNITKYSSAKETVITLNMTDNNDLFLSITDNGVGFDVTKKNPGIGLKNIANRVDFYSGKMNIISSPGKGCALEIFIPS